MGVRIEDLVAVDARGRSGRAPDPIPARCHGRRRLTVSTGGRFAVVAALLVALGADRRLRRRRSVGPGAIAPRDVRRDPGREMR